MRRRGCVFARTIRPRWCPLILASIRAAPHPALRATFPHGGKENGRSPGRRNRSEPLARNEPMAIWSDYAGHFGEAGTVPTRQIGTAP